MAEAVYLTMTREQRLREQMRDVRWKVDTRNQSS
jgi:hypothetical protein